jgi:hypothetical protein
MTFSHPCEQPGRDDNDELTGQEFDQGLGDTISSRDSVAGANELICKVLAANITVPIRTTFGHGI